MFVIAHVSWAPPLSLYLHWSAGCRVLYCLYLDLHDNNTEPYKVLLDLKIALELL